MRGRSRPTSHYGGWSRVLSERPPRVGPARLRGGTSCHHGPETVRANLGGGDPALNGGGPDVRPPKRDAGRKRGRWSDRGGAGVRTRARAAVGLPPETDGAPNLGARSRTPEAQKVLGLVDALVAGWNAGNGAACAIPFARDATHVWMTGQRTHGRDRIAGVYRTMLSTLFRRTRLSASVDDIRFIRPDVALADVSFRIHYEDGSAFMPEPHPGNVPTHLVAARGRGRWSIVAFRSPALL